MKRGYLVATVLLALCTATAIFSLRGAATPNVDFARAEQSHETVQIYGRLVRDLIAMNDKMTRVSFRLSEDKTGRQLAFLYDTPGEPVPANFRSAAQVRVVGIYDPSTRLFRVAQLYTKCPSKYESGGYKNPQSTSPDVKALAPPR